MTNNEKLALLNTIEVMESSACAGELEYVMIEHSQQNIDILVSLGATNGEIFEVTDASDGSIDIAGIGFKYTGAEWFEESLGGFLEQQPVETLELKQVDTSIVKTYKEILLDLGIFDHEIVAKMTEEQCEVECAAIYEGPDNE